ncbi:hypothetical protein POM88_036634 [Heracleum sosnowskyi]|uniref:RNase H type-1 domain-containing protein n=1 Tax=Heracleum sosnowskyi TaxID=360622 RepID=A0AAD8HQK0_9APIA|nr:hypothetical protein POM88_036634 [Heracleum sosnowskyi]
MEIAYGFLMIPGFQDLLVLKFMINLIFLLISVVDLKLENGHWDEEFIKSNFNKEDALCILSLPCEEAEIRDEILWHYSKNGDYSVKSGYKIALRNDNQAEASNMTKTESWLKEELPSDSFDLFVVVSWQVWMSRNNILHGKAIPKDENIVEWCHDFLAEYKIAMSNKVGISPRPRTKWIPPAPGYCKINVDGTKKGIGIGAVVRDDGGNLIEAEAFSYENLLRCSGCRALRH